MGNSLDTSSKKSQLVRTVLISVSKIQPRCWMCGIQCWWRSDTVSTNLKQYFRVNRKRKTPPWPLYHCRTAIGPAHTSSDRFVDRTVIICSQNERQSFGFKTTGTLFLSDWWKENKVYFSLNVLSEAAVAVWMQPHRLPHGAGGRPRHHRHPEGTGRPARGAPPAGALRGRLPRWRQWVPDLRQEAPVKESIRMLPIVATGPFGSLCWRRAIRGYWCCSCYDSVACQIWPQIRG